MCACWMKYSIENAIYMILSIVLIILQACLTIFLNVFIFGVSLKASGNVRTYIRRYTAPNENFENGYLNSNVLFSSPEPKAHR